MKLTIITLVASLVYAFSGSAQTIKIDLKKAGVQIVDIKLSNSTLIVKGNANDTLTVVANGEQSTDLPDSSRTGLRLLTKGDTLTIEKTSSKDVPYLIELPRSISLFIEESLNKPQKLEVRDMEGDVSVSAGVSQIRLINNKGAMTANSLAADIFVVLPPKVDKPSTFTTRGRLVDITIPREAKITLDAEVFNERFFSDSNLNNLVKITSSGFFQTVKGPLNGGGALLKVTSHTLALH